MPQTAGRDAPKGSWVLGLGLARPRTQVRGPVYLYGSIKLILRASPGVTTLLPRACRLTLVVLLVRMWRLNAAPRTILPVPVFLNRFAAPLWVFNFSFFTFLAIPILSLPLLPFRPWPWASARPSCLSGWCASDCPPAAASFPRLRPLRGP